MGEIILTHQLQYLPRGTLGPTGCTVLTLVAWLPTWLSILSFISLTV